MSDTDDANSPQTTSFTVTVLGAPQQLANLQHSVIGVGPGTSLYDKLGQAQSYLAANDKADTCGVLAAFINELKAQSGKSHLRDDGDFARSVGHPYQSCLGLLSPDKSVSTRAVPPSGGVVSRNGSRAANR